MAASDHPLKRLVTAAAQDVLAWVLGQPVQQAVPVGTELTAEPDPIDADLEEIYEHIHETLMAIFEHKMPTQWFWPNVDAGSDKISKGLRVFREKYQPSFVHFFKNMPPETFYKVVVTSACMIGSSSVGIRETSFLGVPSVTIGTRQAGLERGPNVMDVGYDRTEILRAIRSQLVHGPYTPSTLYGDGRAGERMADILADTQLKIEKRITY